MPKRPPSILFLALLDTSKIRSISFTPVACKTSDTLSVSLVRAGEGKLEAGRINLYPPWLEASEESQAQDRGRRSSLASRLPSLAWKTRKNNTCFAGYNSWAKIKYEIYNKKSPQARREGLVC